MNAWFLMVLPLIGSLAWVPGARAALGGDESSIEREARVVGAPSSRTVGTSYARYELKPGKFTLHQFSGTDGKVFAVAWQGKAHPDLAALLGDHFDEFEIALAKARKETHGRAPIIIDSGHLHIEMGGRAMAVYGRVWLLGHVPAETNSDEIR